MDIVFRHRIAHALASLLIAASAAYAETPALTPTPAPAPEAPAPPPSPVNGIRNKISAGDLPSAESILEVHREKNGPDGPWLLGLSWLARGALLLGDNDKAQLYASRVRASCADRMARGAQLDKDHDLEIAYGAAIEVEAQRLQRTKGTRQAVAYLRGEIAQVKSPVPLVARLNKRLNMLSLTGQAAPELAVEDFVGDPPPTLASLRGKPLLLFIWFQGCGDCKAQAASLGRAKSRYAAKGLTVVALTRYYEDEPDRSKEKADIERVWKETYDKVGMVPNVISTASMERYGGSSTPTFVFVDRAGIVRGYTPTRLTELELNRTLDALTR